MTNKLHLINILVPIYYFIFLLFMIISNKEITRSTAVQEGYGGKQTNPSIKVEAKKEVGIQELSAFKFLSVRYSFL